MKNYLKFIVAVFGITVATFSAIDAQAAPRKGTTISDNVCCKGSGDCGYTPDCKKIEGTAGPC